MKFLISLALLGLTTVCAHADIAFVSALQGGQKSANPADTQTKIFIKDGVTRTEISLLGNPMVILTWPNGDTAQIDPTNKFYTVRTGEKLAAEPTNFMGGPMQTVVAIKNLGVQTLKGQKVPHWRIDFETATGEDTAKTAVEIWSSATPFPAPIAAKTDAPATDTTKPDTTKPDTAKPDPVKPAVKDPMLTLADAPVGFRALIAGNAVVKPGVKGMNDVFATVPLRTATIVDGVPRATFEIINVSTADLPATLFHLPTDFRAITRADWNKRENDIIRKKMDEMREAPVKGADTPPAASPGETTPVTPDAGATK